MEQNQVFRSLLILSWLLISTVACKSEHPNPELLDPIYLDMKSSRDRLEKELEAEIKARELAAETIQATAPNTIELKLARKEWQTATEKVDFLRQKLHFEKIRTKRRYVEARRDYKIAFEAGSEWPDPNEFSNYKANKRLKEASRDWNRRVPRLSSRIPASE